MAYPPYDPSTADLTLKYAPHDLANLHVFYGTSAASSTNLNIWVELHGGNDWQPGFDAISQSGAGTVIPDMLLLSPNWIFVQADYPTGACRANAGSILPFALFPEDLDWIAAMIMSLKDQICDGSAMAGGRKGNKNRIVISGTSAGARKAMMMATQPVGTFSYLNGDPALSQNEFAYRNNPRVKGVHSFIGQLDFTLFNANASIDAGYHQVFTRNGIRSWDNTPTRIKWAASPVAHFRRNIPDNNNVGFFFNYPFVGSGLTPANFNPGPNATMLTAMSDPHDPLGVEDVYQGLVRNGNGLCERHWGNNSTNPSNPYISGSTMTNRVKLWTRDTLLLPY